MCSVEHTSLSIVILLSHAIYAICVVFMQAHARRLVVRPKYAAMLNSRDKAVYIARRAIHQHVHLLQSQVQDSKLHSHCSNDSY
jgi:hypothetical protein